MTPKPELPEAITAPFTVVVDSREQAPWHFTGLVGKHGDRPVPLIVPLATDIALKSGDYSIRGQEHRFSIERKSVGDFYGSIGGERERFEREMVRLSELDYAACIVEGDWRQVEEWHRTQMSFSAVEGTIASWSTRYGVHFFLRPGRRAAEEWCWRLMLNWWKRVEHEERERREREVIDAAIAAVTV